MRRKDREVTNIIEILQIIEKAKVLHLALFEADYERYYRVSHDGILSEKVCRKLILNIIFRGIEL